MDLSKISVKIIRELIVFTAILVVALWKFDVVLDVLKAIWGIIFPFVLGGAIAFMTNVPMSFLENKRTMDRPQKKQQESGMEFRFKSIRKDGRQTRGVLAQSAGRYQGCILSVWNIL